MSIIALLVIFVGVEMVIETIVWGTFGCIFFRFIGLKEKYWRWDCLFVFAIYLTWTYFSVSIMNKLDITIGNPEILELLGDDLNGFYETGYMDIITCTVQVLLGYLLGMKILEKLGKRTTKVSSV